MADALRELAQVLFNSKDPKITKQEAQLILACRLHAFTVPTLISSSAAALVFMATGKLNAFSRSSLAGGVGFISGVWSHNKSVDSSVDYILAMEGTRMKHELAKIMRRRYGNDPRRMHLISKHFFSEELFDDSVSDQPKRMYRQRNTFIDNSAQIQRSPDTYGHDESEGDKKVNDSQQKEDIDTERLKNAAAESKQRSVVLDRLEQDDPLDYLLGYSDVNQDIPHPNSTSDNPTRQQIRRQRRSHRRHRLHHRHREHDNPSKMENAQPLV